MTPDWAIGALAAMLLVHLALVVYALVRDGSTASSATTPVSDRTQYGSDGVACPNCGEINEPDYKYCRQCVSELPTGVSVLRESSGPWSRRTL